MMPHPIPHALPGDFVGSELALTPAHYTLELSAAQHRALADLGRAIEADPGASHRLDAAVQAVMADPIASARRLLTTGPGFALVRGIPTEGLGADTLAALFSMIGRALGQPVPQNLEGELITHVRDTGADPRDPEVRLYRTRAEQDFHADGADVIGLLCLHAAARGGESRILSSVRVYRRIAERRPDLAPLLLEPWHFHVPGARARGLPATASRPIVTFDGAKLETFYIGWYIRNAQGLPGVPPLDAARRELLELYDATLADPTLHLDMQFRPGDLQWLRNALVLHKRTAYDDPPPPRPRRHLLRLWLASPDLDDTTPRFDAQGVRS